MGLSWLHKDTILNYFHFAATTADVALLLQLGVDGVFVGSGIFKSGNPYERALAMLQVGTLMEGDVAFLLFPDSNLLC